MTTVFILLSHGVLSSFEHLFFWLPSHFFSYWVDFSFSLLSLLSSSNLSPSFSFRLFLVFLGCYECCLPCIRLSCTTHVTNNILINNLYAIFFSLFNKISPTFGSHSKIKIRGKKKRRKKVKRMAHAKLTFTPTFKAKTNVNTTFWSSHNFDLVGEVYFNRTNARVNNQLLWQSVL